MEVFGMMNALLHCFTRKRIGAHKMSVVRNIIIHVLVHISLYYYQNNENWFTDKKLLQK